MMISDEESPGGNGKKNLGRKVYPAWPFGNLHLPVRFLTAFEPKQLLEPSYPDVGICPMRRFDSRSSAFDRQPFTE
jgi:hypothetical protein